MGIADVIPGVSGGTMALIMGIYRKLIRNIKDLNVRWVVPLYNLATGSDETEKNRERLRQSVERLHLVFFIPLGGGIVTALILGSMTIPPLLKNYPVMTRSFFFGLILASVLIPLQMVRHWDNTTIVKLVIAFMLAAMAGYVITKPNRSIFTPVSWVSFVSDGSEFEHLLKRAPSAMPAEPVFWNHRNKSLRTITRNRERSKYKRLKNEHRNFRSSMLSDRELIEARSEAYEGLYVPSGTTIYVPKIPTWYVFVVGAVAICAMILPGISGAYILLILGAYFYVLNSLKVVIESLLSFHIRSAQLTVVVLFCLGALIGLLGFSRGLNYLLDDYTDWTVGALSGLMIGCLRGVWPFRAKFDATTINVIPDSFTTTVNYSLLSVVVGVLLVMIMHMIPVTGKKDKNVASGGNRT